MDQKTTKETTGRKKYIGLFYRYLREIRGEMLGEEDDCKRVHRHNVCISTLPPQSMVLQ